MTNDQDARLDAIVAFCEHQLKLAEKRTPGKWVWTAANAGPQDSYGYETRGPIDPLSYDAGGYSNNPELCVESCPSRETYGEDGQVIMPGVVISAGYGEYNPVHGDTPEQRAANANFIASCAGAAEAGWKATVASIERMRRSIEVGHADMDLAEDALLYILVAWADETLEIKT